MRVPISHTLPREEVRRRLRERSHEIAGHIPGGMAQVDTEWPSEDRMTLAINAMGQQLSGVIDIEDNQVVVDIALPGALSFFEPVVSSALHDRGQKLLAP
ncbi:polyhydroxyalkanoic acid system family protein [Qipengyuania sp. DSG2-2]|uniref:polyhydroxyalkanoic acid system family protein n=1 Tax=Qipengyuania sp. DGS2-2 TaxID=3349631 RepID=UPI0036D2D79D